ncbi:HD domain-containing protein [Lipingzhangella sp. LS1_29]|uniref:HD domain-containing protein n=1 Tax=Lipingzhangella rawalii TaxID=2055835 RepID=A0ABU2HB47_9ACTN|nr:HD domain-containing protein [Lipingzhangella rawalii]MDS1272045.1 HD domain-containing protein [Lipingzhangella rawalii]
MGTADPTTGATSRTWWQRLNAATAGRIHHTEVEPLVREHLRWHPRAGVDTLRRAYAVAHHLHDGQRRKSGEPYISHPLAVALILAETGVDTATLVAALLHDTVEDTPYTVGQLRAQFGDEVAIMVDGVTKLDRSMYGADAAGETFRKMVLAASADLRVLLIKLADRLHNLRTLAFQPPHKQRKIAAATREALIPFAERLGVYALKRELEDLCFAYLEPEAYEATVNAIAEARSRDRAELDGVVRRLRDVLSEFRIKNDVIVRDRHPYSVHTTRGGHLEGLDSFGVSRIIVTVPRDSRDCYIALGAVHSAWKPLPARLKDFIAVPKYNLYRALHTTVVNNSGRVFEVIVCTAEEYRVSEYGLIAHVADATSDDGRRAVTRRADLEWLQRLLSWQGQVSADELLQGVRTDLVPDSMVTFTREGDLVTLPRGATALDFAYALSPELGDRYMGAQVDGRLVPAATRLRDGQTVEILTSEDSSASASWLTVVKTGPARSGITQRLAEQQAERDASQGRAEIRERLRTAGYSLLELEGTGVATSVARRLGYADLEGLYTAANSGDIDPGNLVTELVGSVR